MSIQVLTSGSKSAVDTIFQCFRNNVFLTTEDTYTARKAAEKCMMEDVIRESVSYSESSRDAHVPSRHQSS